MVGKMFRPFWLAQIRTTLRTLMYCYSIHRLLPPPIPRGTQCLNLKTMAIRRRARRLLLYFRLIARAECVIGRHSREDRACVFGSGQLSFEGACRPPIAGLKGRFCGVRVTIDDLQVRQPPKLKQLRPRGVAVFVPHAKERNAFLLGPAFHRSTCQPKR
jgi:hypothetical protein